MRPAASRLDLPLEALQLATVLGATEEECDVYARGRRTAVPFASSFPRPRAQRVAPGHLVALAMVNGSQVVAWRWFDAVVVSAESGVVRLWEPGHGTVSAKPRDASRTYVPGTRAYLSAGLPGAEWWVAGPVVDHAEEADVDLDEVERFLHGASS